MRHENGNCLPCGGFCTAVNDSICEALHKAFAHGEAEERDRMVLCMVEANTKYQERQLEILRNIHERVVADTAAVVRCKDCRFWHKDTVSCDFVTADTNWYEEDFCSYGERKTDGLQ